MMVPTASGTQFHPDRLSEIVLCAVGKQRCVADVDFYICSAFLSSDSSDRYFDMACWQKTGNQACLGRAGRPLK